MTGASTRPTSAVAARGMAAVVLSCVVGCIGCLLTGVWGLDLIDGLPQEEHKRWRREGGETEGWTLREGWGQLWRFMCPHEASSASGSNKAHNQIVAGSSLASCRGLVTWGFPQMAANDHTENRPWPGGIRGPAPSGAKLNSRHRPCNEQ